MSTRIAIVPLKKTLGMMRLIGLFCSLAVVTGCTALTVSDANEQLTAAYQAKVAAMESTPRDQTGLLLAQTSLSQVADDAGVAVEQTRGAANRISLYRIATVAAWQASDSGATDRYATLGQTLCAEQERPPPRDCGMLAIIPSLRSIDEQTAALEALRQRIRATRPGPAEREEAERIFSNYKDGFNRILAQRTHWAGGTMPDGFIQAVDANLGVLVCNQVDNVLMSQIGALSDRTLLVEKRQAVADMKCQMDSAGVSKEQAPCAACGL
jgi:hypothetical protein